MRWMSRISQPAFLLFLTLTISCSESEPKLDLYPLKGTVTRNGQPVKGGGMILAPLASPVPGMSVNASVNLDGTFEAETLRTGKDGRTNAEPGAPAGKYKVTYHPPSNGSKMGLETELSGPVTLEAKANTIQIELPSKIPEGQGQIRDDDPEMPEGKKLNQDNQGK